MKFLIFVLSLALWAQDFERLTLGGFGEEKPSILFDRYRPITTKFQSIFSQAQLQGDVKLRVVPKESELVALFVRGEVDFCPLSPLGYIEVMRRKPNTVLVGGEIVDGKFLRQGKVCAMTDTSIRALQDIVGKKVGLGPLGDPFYDLAARAFLVSERIDISQVEFLRFKNTREIPGLLEVGRFQLGLVPTKVFEQNPDKFRSFGDVQVPGRVWVAREELYPYQQDWIKEVLFDLDPVFLQRFSCDQIAAVNKADFDDFTRYLRILRIL